VLLGLARARAGQGAAHGAQLGQQLLVLTALVAQAQLALQPLVEGAEGVIGALQLAVADHLHHVVQDGK